MTEIAYESQIDDKFTPESAPEQRETGVDVQELFSITFKPWDSYSNSAMWASSFVTTREEAEKLYDALLTALNK